LDRSLKLRIVRPSIYFVLPLWQDRAQKKRTTT
jgi:hypothetical protein